MAMDSSSSQSHRQEMGSQTLESMLIPRKAEPEKKPKPAEQALKCPRCDSTNTKFCYYNNYSLSQPRYFCKSCRRYWTKGGTLRNVPVGGGCRKTKRSSSKKSHDNQPIKLNPTLNIPLPYNSNIFTSGSQLGLDDPGFPISQDPNMPVSGFLENPLGFQNLYYGIGDGGNLGLEINGLGMGIEIGLNQDMGLVGFDEINGATTASTAVTTVKQEMCSGIGRDSGGLWGFPWQNVGGDGNMGESDLTKFGNWNGIGYASNWQGLLNSPLVQLSNGV